MSRILTHGWVIPALLLAAVIGCWQRPASRNQMRPSVGRQAARPPAPPESSATANSSKPESAGGPTVRPATGPQKIPPAAQNAASGASERASSRRSRQDADPFVDWPQPAVVLVFTGGQDGYIEPCGCSGLENKKGGLARRYSFLKALRGRGWSVAPCDVGGQIKRTGPQAEIKLTRTIEALQQMEYAAATFGTSDLKVPAGNLASLAVDDKSVFCTANVGLFGLDAGLVKKFRIVQQGGKKLGITAVLGDTYAKEIKDPEMEIARAADSLRDVVPALKKQADVLILLAHATLEESLELATAFPEFDIIVTSGGADEPPAQPRTASAGKTLIVEVGHKGMHACAVGLYADADAKPRYAKIKLDNTFAEAEPMMELLASYQQQLETLGLAGLGIKPVAHPSGRTFVGSQSCGECHTKAFAVWKDTPHAHALETLEQLQPARHHDPECISCHVTGWEPQRYYPFASGFRSRQQSPLLVGNGCENCHGPGSAHVSAEMGDVEVADAELLARRAAMRVSLKQSRQTCADCHDIDNSPDFDFDSYWSEVEHRGKD